MASLTAAVPAGSRTAALSVSGLATGARRRASLPKLVAAVDPADYEPEMFELHGRELFMWWPAGVHKARLTHSFWERKLKVTATARNWNTVERLLELAGRDGPV